LRVFTEGILTRQLLSDPFLEGVGAVLLDEFHERNIHTDVAAALLREVQQTVRPDLILVIMSATLEAEPAAKFLGGCPIVRAEGRTFAVEIEYRPSPGDRVPERVARAVESVVTGAREGEAAADAVGDVLAFLPGVDEIRRTIHALEPLAQREDLLLLPLHSSLPPHEQLLALRPARRRKVILATNIAETSLTIDGVRTVVDSGLARVAGYDPQRGMDRLELKHISQASATQRAGRAGRTAPGRCVRLWSAKEQHALPAFEVPEIRRVDLASTVLSLHAWGKPDPMSFGWYEPPPPEMVASAERLLAMLGALTGESGGSITELGRRLLTLPVHPRLARLMIEAMDAGRIVEGATLAALLSEKDVVMTDRPNRNQIGSSRVQGRSDVLVRMQLLADAERQRFAHHLHDRGIDPGAARQVVHTRDQLLRIASRAAPPNAPDMQAPGSDRNEDELLKMLLLAYPDRVARRRPSDPATAGIVGGGAVRLALESVVCQPEFFLALDARKDERSATREAFVRVASEVQVEWLEELFPQSIRRERSAVYDEQRDRVVGHGRVNYRDLLLWEDTDAAVDAQAAGRVLADWARPRAVDLLRAHDACLDWTRRVELLRMAMPENRWPDVHAAAPAVLTRATEGRSSLREARLHLLPVLRGLLEYPLDRLLETEAPEAIDVPSGSRIGLEYPDQGDALNEPPQIKPPVLAVRLQEVFGWRDTPRVAGGRVPVLLHLLGPNFRPVQVTSDLKSFWSTTYFQVRKDLRRRYPKHSWPEDPLSAAPVAKGARKK
ncbi:MAG: ATP-dependent helicase HrpB, partial [Tepidisphaeraceae bacterium]